MEYLKYWAICAWLVTMGQYIYCMTTLTRKYTLNTNVGVTIHFGIVLGMALATLIVWPLIIIRHILRSKTNEIACLYLALNFLNYSIAQDKKVKRVSIDMIVAELRKANRTELADRIEAAADENTKGVVVND